MNRVGGALMTGCGGADPEALSETTTTTPPETTTTTEAPVEAGQVLYVYRPGVGDCYDRRRVDGDSGEFVTLLLDCSLPHTYQVFATFEFDDSTRLRPHRSRGDARHRAWSRRSRLVPQPRRS